MMLWHQRKVPIKVVQRVVFSLPGFQLLSCSYKQSICQIQLLGQKFEKLQHWQSYQWFLCCVSERFKMQNHMTTYRYEILQSSNEQSM